MPTELLIRNVPDEIKKWLGEAKPGTVSQNEFLLGLLKNAHEMGLEPTLFQQLPQMPASPSSPIRFTFVDLFAGIGGFRIGMTANGGRCVFTCEWDRFSQRTYQAWFGAEKIWGDITSDELDLETGIPDHDVLCAGFPCQPFSIAGVSKKKSLGMAHGFDDKKQGNLFFRLCEIIDAKRPPVVFLENVKNLRSHDKGNTWRVIKNNLEQRQYTVFDQTIDAQSWVPQHRERIFIVCFDRDVFGDKPPFEFPSSPLTDSSPKLGDILEPKPDPKYTLTDHLWNYLQRYAEKHRAKGNGFGFGLVGPDDITRTLSARYYKDGSEILIRQDRKNPRRLTHREAARLMGYSDAYARMFGHADGFPIVVSDTQAYRQFGNSVVPSVVEAVGKQIVHVLNWQIERTRNGCLIKARRDRARSSMKKTA